ncbi:MAG: glycoside hydrolase family 3 C-terminal domain-containing protein [Treponema sp.]|nr:glycoside hydrolase family 3 C-terminal domain-containing protein [Treponema sp.]
MAHSDSDIRKLVSELTLEEKCSLLSGSDFWRTKAVERLGIPKVMVSDGPHGLRKQAGEDAGVNDSIQAVCFPAACATSSSFSRDVYKKLGSVLADECQANDVSTILGPAINIKRSPLCGRNFEYISEDPFVAGELSASYINAVQEKHVGTSLKHFALNNQEYRRLTNSSNCDERTMREIYLPAFEIAVKKSQPATIMHSYNLINGTYAGESKWLLTDVLRNEWGFKGVVVSDWGAVSDRIRGVKAGGDLEMPSSDGSNDRKVLNAASNDKELLSCIDESVFRILRWVYNFVDNRSKGEFDFKAHHEIAREIEEESIVLLKNDGVLPLTGKEKIAVIGEFAASPRFQGGGSSHINTKTVTNALDALKALGYKVTYAPGFQAVPDKDERKASEIAGKLSAQAIEYAKDADTILVFAGLPDSFESEGYDRTKLDLPEEQNILITTLCRLKKKVVVLLHNGSPVTMPWKDEVSAVVELYLGGEAVGEAAANVLSGKVNPSGKLAETFPLRLEDTPAFMNFANHKTQTNYGEGIFVGYRWYDARKMDVLFPFGFGLSYTTFQYSDLRLSSDSMDDDGSVKATVTVTNTGKTDGKEIVQLYVSDKTHSAVRPVKELKGFEKVFIPAGKSVDVEFTLDKRSLAWYNTEMGDWYAASGEYEILAGPSSRNLPCSSILRFTTAKIPPLEINVDTTVGDLLRDSRTKPVIESFMKGTKSDVEVGSTSANEAISAEMIAQMMDGNPLRNFVSWGHLSDEKFEELLASLKNALKSPTLDAERRGRVFS